MAACAITAHLASTPPSVELAPVSPASLGWRQDQRLLPRAQIALWASIRRTDKRHVVTVCLDLHRMRTRSPSAMLVWQADTLAVAKLFARYAPQAKHSPLASPTHATIASVASMLVAQAPLHARSAQLGSTPAPQRLPPARTACRGKRSQTRKLAHVASVSPGLMRLAQLPLLACSAQLGSMSGHPKLPPA